MGSFSEEFCSPSSQSLAVPLLTAFHALFSQTLVSPNSWHLQLTTPPNVIARIFPRFPVTYTSVLTTIFLIALAYVIFMILKTSLLSRRKSFALWGKHACGDRLGRAAATRECGPSRVGERGPTHAHNKLPYEQTYLWPATVAANTFIIYLRGCTCTHTLAFKISIRFNLFERSKWQDVVEFGGKSSERVGLRAFVSGPFTLTLCFR